MNQIFKNVLIIYKEGHGQAAILAEQVAEWLEQNGLSACVCEAAQQCPESRPKTCIVVAGGDGTILGVARKFACAGIPIFGINFGRVGFLTSAEPATWQESLTKVLSGSIQPRSCLALQWQVERLNGIREGGIAINDVVLARGRLARLAAMSIHVNGQPLGILRGDGIIACSPLGSTGYSVSAGGPFLHMDLDAIGLTAICPFLARVSPLVFPGSSEFQFQLEAPSAECYLTIDGQEGRKIGPEEVVHLRGIKNAVLIFARGSQFFEKMIKRGLSFE